MLITKIKSQFLTYPLRYCISLHQKSVTDHFDKNFREARQKVQIVMDEYNLNKNQARKYFAYYPLAFKPETPQNTFLKQRHAKLRNLAQQQSIDGCIARVFLQVLFQNRTMGFILEDEDLQKIFRDIKEFKMTESQIKKIFTWCPNLINPKFKVIMMEKLQIFKFYLGLSTEESLQIIEAAPFILPGSTRSMRQSMTFLRKDAQFSIQQTIELIKQLGELLFLGRAHYAELMKVYRDWGLNKENKKQIIYNNPLLLLNIYNQTLPMKLKLMKYFNFTTDMRTRAINEFPQIFVFSVRSFQAKGLFLTKIGIKINDQSLQLLKYRFNRTLRPRCQLVLKTRRAYDGKKLVELMRLSDQEFASKLDITMEQLDQEISRYDITPELDFKENKLYKKVNSRQRIIKMSQKYDL